MTEDQLRAFIAAQESRSKRDETAAEQAKAMDYYLGRPFGNEEEGRSSVMSSDVWDVVEGLTPLVLKPFVGSDDVVRFQPRGAEDVDAAQQETDYINWVVTQRNDLFEQLVAWVKAGLLQKNGVVKYWWEAGKRSIIRTYLGQSEDVFTAIVQDDNVQVLEHSEYLNQIDIDGQTVTETLHDFKIKVTEETGQAKYAVCPPEEIRVVRDARSPNIKQSPFVQHITRKTLSALREMGYDIDDDLSDYEEGPDTEEQAVSRETNGELLSLHDGDGDPSMREVWFKETYCFVDFDGDGIAERRKVCQVGSTILANEEIEDWPFASWTPYPQLFQYDGRCPADETTEIQEVKTTLWRQGLDNLYTINNNRTFVSDKVNLDDMLDNAIAGIVRVKGDVVGNHAMSMPVTPIGQVIYPMMEYLDAAKETRTGFTRANQGSSDLGNQKTLGEVQIVAEAGMERTGLISRCFAEIGLKHLMLGIHKLCRQHATREETVQLRGKWVSIDPRRWEERYDMTVAVGLGTTDKRMQLQGHQMLMAEQKAMAQVQGLVTPENFFASSAKLAELIGEKDAGRYFTDPKQQAPQIPPQVQGVLQQAQAQLQQAMQRIQELESGLAAKQVEAQAKAQVEQIRQQGAEMERQFQAFIQRMKDEAAYDRQELAGVITLLAKQVQPPPALGDSVSQDMQENDGPA